MITVYLKGNNLITVYLKGNNSDLETKFILSHFSSCIKDIVQPKKRGVKRGMNQFVSTSYTIADVFFEHLKG